MVTNHSARCQKEAVRLVYRGRAFIDQPFENRVILNRSTSSRLPAFLRSRCGPGLSKCFATKTGVNGELLPTSTQLGNRDLIDTTVYCD